MLFLWLVETPHIEKIYGSEGDESGKKGYTKANYFVIKNFDKFRSSDVSLIIIGILFTLTMYFGSINNGPLDSDFMFLSIAVVFRFLASFIIALILILQDRTKFWTKHFELIGQSKFDAFNEFKRLFNLLTTLQHLSFFFTAIRLFKLPEIEILMSPLYITQILIGIMLIGIARWSFNCVYSIIGEHGIFFGDFFFYNDDEPKLTYTGIYRYMNNPDVYLGHLWMYGIACFCSSLELFVLGFFGQTLHILFLQLIEKPRLKLLYKHSVRKYSSGVHKVIITQTKRLINKISD